MAGVKLLMPGYEFAQKNSELQAVLGVAKDSTEMAALRKQARQLGDNTAARQMMQPVRRLLLRKPVGMLMPFRRQRRSR